MKNIIKIELSTPFAVGSVNAYLVAGKNPVLVDCGPCTEEAKKALIRGVEEAGFTMPQITAAILTHYHPDHAGLALWLQQEYGITIAAFHESVPFFSDDRNFHDSRIAFYRNFYNENGVPEALVEKELKKLVAYRSYCPSFNPDIIIKENLDACLLPDWKAVHVPGHSPDHISLFHEDSRTLIGGDVLLPRISSNALIEPEYDGKKRMKTLLQYRKTLRELAALMIRNVYPGHGDPFSDASSLISERLRDHDSRAAHILEILKKQPGTAFSVAERLFPRLYKKEAGLVLSEVIGHLDLLEEREMVIQERSIENASRYFAGVAL